MTGTSRVEHSSESKGIPKCWKMLVSILPYGRGSTIHTGYTVHVVENERHIINKVSCHESVYSCKNSLIGGLFGVILGVKGAHKHKMEQSWIGEQNIVQWGFVLVFVLDEFVRIGKLSKAEIFGLFFESGHRGCIYEFKARNGLENRATQGNLDALHIAHNDHAFGGRFGFQIGIR